MLFYLLCLHRFLIFSSVSQLALKIISTNAIFYIYYHNKYPTKCLFPRTVIEEITLLETSGVRYLGSKAQVKIAYIFHKSCMSYCSILQILVKPYLSNRGRLCLSASPLLETKYMHNMHIHTSHLYSRMEQAAHPKRYTGKIITRYSQFRSVFQHTFQV